MTLSTCEVSELLECREKLMGVLQKLDDIGAGVAAIHVDAAIVQLAGNLEGLIEQHSSYFDPALIWVCEEPPKVY